MIYSLLVIKALGGGHLRFWKRSYVRDPFTPHKTSLVASFFASQPYIESVQYDDTVKPDINLDDFRAEWMRLRKQGTHGRYNLAEIFLKTFGLPLELAREKWLDIPPSKSAVKPAVIFSRSFRYRGRFPWKMAHDKYGKVAAFLGLPEEYREFVGNVGDVTYIATPTLLEAAQLISSCRLFIGNQNALMAVAIGCGKTVLQETWPSDSNCLFPCVTPCFDEKIILPDL